MNLTNQIPQNEAVDVALYDTAAPGQGEPRGDRVLIPPQSHHEGPQRRQVVGVHRGHPRLQVLTAARTHHRGEAADVPGQRSQLRTGGEDRVQALLVGRVDGRGIGHDPTDDTTDRRPLTWWRRDAGSRTERAQVLTDEGRATAVAACGDLAEQDGRVGASGVETVVQIRLERLQQAGPAPGSVTGQQFLHGVGAGEPSRRAPCQAQLAADCCDTNPFSDQLVHCGVPLPGAYAHRSVRSPGPAGRAGSLGLD